MTTEERDRIVREKALAYAREHDGLFKLKCLDTTERRFLYNTYKSTETFCSELGIQYKKNGNKKVFGANKKRGEMQKPVLDGGIEVPYEEQGQKSICWECKHSATRFENACSWDRDFVIPNGATFSRKSFKNGNKTKGYTGVKILSCPLFEKM